MELQERHVGDVVVLDLSGQLTLSADGSERLKDKINSLLQQGLRDILVNLGEVPTSIAAASGSLSRASHASRVSTAASSSSTWANSPRVSSR